ncbi:MAG: tRNA (N(6)-L-threonylcarbamoyladenosine(37)-C(2))-methylthiotransferase [Candidatus Anstonellales archaeon]
MKVYIETYGCTLNQAESDMLAGLLKAGGFSLVSDERNADVVVLNTCTVKLSTQNKILARIREIKKPLVVAGCLWVLKEKIRRANKNTVLLSPSSIPMVVDAVRDAYNKKWADYSLEFAEKNFSPREYTAPILRVPIQEGCVGNCTFCQTKLARPKLVSFDEKWICEQIKNGIKNGAKEIQITGMDAGAYGLERNTNLVELLRKIVRVDGEFFVRLGMVNPHHVKRMLSDLIEIYKNKKMFKFLHVPVQTGSEKVCREMNRGHTVKDFFEVIDAFRNEIPDISIATDIIVGYPTESEEDFEKTIMLLKKIKPDVVNISKFTPREKTKAAGLRQLPTETIKERSVFLSRFVRNLVWKKNQKFLGKKLKVLITEKFGKGVKGRTMNYRQVFVNRKIPLGKIIEVRIKSATNTTLFA